MLETPGIPDHHGERVVDPGPPVSLHRSPGEATRSDPRALIYSAISGTWAPAWYVHWAGATNLGHLGGPAHSGQCPRTDSNIWETVSGKSQVGGENFLEDVHLRKSLQN